MKPPKAKRSDRLLAIVTAIEAAREESWDGYTQDHLVAATESVSAALGRALVYELRAKPSDAP